MMSMNSSESDGVGESNIVGRHSGGIGSGGGGGRACGACQFLRRKCLPTCIFAPYFDPEQGANQFAGVHKVFGAKNVSKLLLNTPVDRRAEAAITICYEAQARMRDPIYGCCAHICTLQQQVITLQNELSYHQAQLVELPQPPPPLQQASIATAKPTTYDLSSTLFYPMAQSPCTMMLQSAMDTRYQYVSGGTSANGSDGNIIALASELMQRNGPALVATSADANANNASPRYPHPT